MSLSNTISFTCRAGDATISKTETITGEARKSYRVSVPDSTDDQLVDVAFLIDDLKFAYILSDQNVTLETNNGGAPVDTINLTANKPAVWTDYLDGLLGSLFSQTVTAFYFTNASGATASITIEILHD